MAYLSHLTLTNFRNLVQIDLELPPGIVVFFGPNAQGKTTLMEAVYLLAIARSFRAENEREVVNFGSAADGGQALVGGTVERTEDRLAVYVGYQSVPAVAPGVGVHTVRKEIRVSRVRFTAAQLVGLVTSVLFTADDVQLVLGPPSARRKFLDILISQADNLYLKGLQRYQRVVQQRNRLLRLCREGRAGADELVFWDDELVREGAWLTWRRAEAVKGLNALCAEHHLRLSGTEDDFRMEYRPSVPAGRDLPEVEDTFRESLAATAARERATATTTVGPHRDDFDLLLNQVDMGVYSSRGQARTIALSLRLAEAGYLASVRREGPIMLLDDVLSEMDASRRRRVMEETARYQQTLITTTDVDLVRDHYGSSAEYFLVENGKVCLAA